VDRRGGYALHDCFARDQSFLASLFFSTVGEECGGRGVSLRVCVRAVAVCPSGGVWDGLSRADDLQYGRLVGLVSDEGV